ncbi:MAG TPA: oxygen-dependent coproporphyrinogen oxidase [Bacteroidia bacterium]|jgi:coproporphyrinogen III oxidase|nr:oxygen-dependent coproporphyrinogen oxidase [Bacteroidia bacterium]
MARREDLANWLKELQNSICNALEIADGKAKFSREPWNRSEGGGGVSHVIQNGNVLEKGGVNFSAVHGAAPSFLLNEKEHTASPLEKAGVMPTTSNTTFYATGVSIVLHPANPMIPIIHMNIRYFEMSNGVYWLGGGIDLTPHYVNENDATFFHKTLKAICDKHHLSYYPKFKKWADDYFFIPHRNETRGIGGIFFDRLVDEEMSFEKNISFWKEVGESFVGIYTELIKRGKDLPFTEKEKQWQLIRRGRYAEFNLVYDKGTKFGLETNGRIESVLMSLPPLASWHYNFTPQPGSAEEKTITLLKKGINRA